MCSSINPNTGGGNVGGGNNLGGGNVGGGNVGGGTAGGTTRGNMSLRWTLDSQGCALVPQVVNVRVTIPGETLQNNGVFPCSASGIDGITLLNFAAGSYTVTVEALDNTNRVLFGATRTVTVLGDVSVTLDLLPENANGMLRLAWSFPLAVRCAQTGDVGTARPVSRVHVTLDAQTPQDFGCLDGSTADNASAAVVLPIRPGAHTVRLQAFDSTGFEFYAATSTFTATATTMNLPVALQWVVGSLPLRWSFVNQGATITCAQAQVMNVFINLKDQATQRFVYVDGSGAPTAGISVPCTSANAIQGTLFPYLPAASYEVFLQAPISSNTFTYRTSQSQPPVIAVSAGVFAQSEAMGLLLPMQ